MLNYDDLPKLRELAQKATPGPWRDVGMAVTAKELGYARVADTELNNEFMAENDAFIATLNPATVIELLDMIERLRKDYRMHAEIADNLGEFLDDTNGWDEYHAWGRRSGRIPDAPGGEDE